MQEKNAPARKFFLSRCPENTAISSLLNTGLPPFSCSTSAAQPLDGLRLTPWVFSSLHCFNCSSRAILSSPAEVNDATSSCDFCNRPSHADTLPFLVCPVLLHRWHRHRRPSPKTHPPSPTPHTLPPPPNHPRPPPT